MVVDDQLPAEYDPAEPADGAEAGLPTLAEESTGAGAGAGAGAGGGGVGAGAGVGGDWTDGADCTDCTEIDAAGTDAEIPFRVFGADTAAPGDWTPADVSCMTLGGGVADAGEGVRPEDREKIFERFGRGTSSQRTRSDGVGLGLSIVAAIADAHGGRVALYDSPGGGATFAMIIPLDAPRSARDADTPQEA